MKKDFEISLTSLLYRKLWVVKTGLIQLFLLIALANVVFAQDTSFPALDIAKTRFADSLNRYAFFTSTPKNEIQEAGISSLSFPDTGWLARSVPPELMERDCYLKFLLYNSSDSIKEVFFLPAFYLKSLQVYRSDRDFPNTLQKINQSASTPLLPRGVLLTIPPGDTMCFYAKFQFVRTNVNNYLPRIIEKDYLRQFKTSIKNRYEVLDQITFIASGLLLLMIFYSVAVYIQTPTREFLFYSIYTLCTCVLLFLKSFFDLDSGAFHVFYEEYLDFMILCVGIFFYLYFLRSFLNTRNKYPFIDKFLRIADVILLGLLSVYSMIYFLTEKYVVLNIMENYVIKLFLFVIGIVFIFYSIRKKNRLLNFLALGNLALLIFSLISQYIILYKPKIVADPTSIFNRAMFYYIIGLVFELLFFLFGLAYKNKRDIIEQAKESERLKLDNERKELEKQIAIMAAQQEERDRISADMHDELGSGVTAIRLMSEIVKSKMKEGTFAEIEKISNSANDLLGKMNTIIWTMKSSNDTLESLVAYIRAYSIEYFDNNLIECCMHVGAIPDFQISGEKRRNIFLGIKEALHNIVKHAKATEVNIHIEVSRGHLTIKIADNGVGIDAENHKRFGNGLHNMRKRMESIDGNFEIIRGSGTTLLFQLPV